MPSQSCSFLETFLIARFNFAIFWFEDFLAVRSEHKTDRQEANATFRLERKANKHGVA